MIARKVELVIVLKPIKDNLKKNVGRFMERKQADVFKFREFLESILVSSGRKIMAHDYEMVEKYAAEMRREYGNLLNSVSSEVDKGELIGLNSYIHKTVNGKFSNAIERFLIRYDKESKKDRSN